jgi:hypothetical protein
MNRDKNFAFIEFRTGRGSETVYETMFGEVEGASGGGDAPPVLLHATTVVVWIFVGCVKVSQVGRWCASGLLSVGGVPGPDRWIMVAGEAG